MHFTRSSCWLYLLLTASGCANAPDAAPATDWMKAAGLPEEVVLQEAGVPVELPASPAALNEGMVLALALRHSALLQAELAHLRTASAAAAQSRLWPNPLLTVAVRVEEGGGMQADLGLSAAMVQMLNRSDRQRAADARLRAAAADTLAAAWSEVESARRSYARALEGRALLPLRARQAEIAAELWLLTRQRQTAGEAGALEVAAAQQRSAQRAAALAQARQALRAAERELAARIGAPAGGARWTLTAGDLPQAGALDSWLAAADERNPAVQRARWLAEATVAEAALAGALVREGGQAGLSAEYDAEWSAGPVLTRPLPFFDDGSARRDGAAAAVLAANHGLVAEKRAVRAAVRAAWEELDAFSERREQLLAREVPPQSAQLALARASAEAGEASAAQVLAAEDALLELQAGLLQTEANLRQAYARLVAAAGGLRQPEITARP